MVDLAGQSRFFVGVAMGLAIGETMNLAISKAVLLGKNVAISFSGLSLW